jgi:NTE family protein
MERHMGGLKIEDLGRPYAAMATDLLTGHEVWLRKGDLVKAIRTSFSLPGIFEPVRSEGRWLVDGALVNPVPVSACRAMGAQMTIGVNLNADLIGKARRPGTDFQSIAGFDLLEEMQGSDPAATGSKLSSLGRRLFKRQESSPSLFGVMVSALNIVQDRITRSRLAGEPPDVHITPRLGHIGLLEFDRADEVIAEGEAAVERVLPDLRAAYGLFGNDIAANGGNGK